MDNINGEEILKKIERCGRTCYQSQDKITEDSAKRFVAMVLKRGHESVIEHVNITVKLITNLRVLAEITRQRLASYSVESSRYVNYKEGLTFIQPCWLSDMTECPPVVQGAFTERDYNWHRNCLHCEEIYKSEIENGAKPEEVSNYLPKDTKTEIVMTANLREWRHIFQLRTAKASHPQMRELMIPLLKELQSKIPVVFDDIEVDN
jgi:thymidylate synthase (FAD)